MSEIREKYCLVPTCNNTAGKCANKKFILVPGNLEWRRKWFHALFGINAVISKTTRLYVCEDHFNLEEDAENYLQYKMIGKLLRLKKDVVPHRNLEARTTENEQPKEEDSPSSKKQKMNVSIPSKQQIRLKSFSFAALSGSSFVHLSTPNEDISEENMEKLNLKVTLYNIEHNSKLFLGIPQKEYFLIKFTEEKCKIDYQHVMITFKKIRCNDSFARLATLFGCTSLHIIKTFLYSVPIIILQYQKLIFFPPRKKVELYTPLQFLPTYRNVKSIINCLEIEIDRPLNAKLRDVTWNQQKRIYCIKYLISSTPHGFINFISHGYGGCVSDKEIVEKSEYLNKLPANCKVLAVRGFENIEDLLQKNNCLLVRLPSVQSSDRISKYEKIQRRNIAACRFYSQSVLRRICEFKMLDSHAKVDINLVPWIDSILTITCALINSQDSSIS